MSASESQPYLPLEIILNVIDFVVPTSSPSPIALAPGHPAAKTILSLLTTSRAIYPVACRLLYTHCMYIHTSQRLSHLLRTLKSANPDLLSSITSLYLRPFPLREDINCLNPPTARDTKDLLKLIGPYLRRLLIDIPLRSLYPEDDLFSVRPILRSAFIDLPVLEEFCSVRDELYLALERDYPSREPPVWSLWPNLKKLALYNQDLSRDDFWTGLRQLQHIETLVMTRSDGTDEVDLQQMWRSQFDSKEETKRLTIVLANVELDQPELRARESWKEDDKLAVEIMNVPISYYGDEDYIVLCQQWIKRGIMSGTLFDEWSRTDEKKKCQTRSVEVANH
ncbi:uncharacterized protein LY89DRAFT_262378 [Mollisia scopiformis]|uniref:Uncharacterized protein n=1 Tax=Mollisia scopiformis TaxID=149040 RepID=A0A132BDL1_MOLSC|nr:uncharacterized protein LY89DRAFT_262378 [Mollisia scopiformis]KUJ10471.1 hypothetical protein LY89DRAFT_262378 [Mollisia scopiformis]